MPLTDLNIIFHCVSALFFLIKQFCYAWAKYNGLCVSPNLKVKLYVDFSDTARLKK